VFKNLFSKNKICLIITHSVYQLYFM